MKSTRLINQLKNSSQSNSLIEKATGDPYMEGTAVAMQQSYSDDLREKSIGGWFAIFQIVLWGGLIIGGLCTAFL